jgi:hypothetical protein
MIFQETMPILIPMPHDDGIPDDDSDGDTDFDLNGNVNFRFARGILRGGV